MEELDHETCESLECTGDSYGRAHFDEDTLGCMDVDLQFSCFVDRRVEKG